MIRVVMLGRTGNNLFQYALGRVLSERHGVPLVLDGSWFNPEGWSSACCVRRLPLRARVVRRLSLASRLLRKVSRKHHWEFLGQPVLKEGVTDHRFERRFLEAPPSCVLMGYFQSPLYFESVEESLRSELRMDDLPWSAATRKMEQRMVEGNSVAVHVRRDDYVRNPNLHVCTIDYYERAMEKLRGRHTGLRFHLFSDDPAWCRENFSASDCEVCDLPEAAGNPLHDLFLMSRARHHIIANSSYSWWAAWLGKRMGQQVIMPSVWIRGIVAPIEEKALPGWEIVNTSAHGDE